MRPSELSCVTIMIASHANFVFTYASDFFEIKCRLCTKNHHVNFEMSHVYVESFSNYEQSVLCPVISCVNFKLSHLYLRQQGGRMEDVRRIINHLTNICFCFAFLNWIYAVLLKNEEKYIFHGIYLENLVWNLMSYDYSLDKLIISFRILILFYIFLYFLPTTKKQLRKMLSNLTPWFVLVHFRVSMYYFVYSFFT